MRPTPGTCVARSRRSGAHTLTLASRSACKGDRTDDFEAVVPAWRRPGVEKHKWVAKCYSRRTGPGIFIFLPSRRDICWLALQLPCVWFPAAASVGKHGGTRPSPPTSPRFLGSISKSEKPSLFFLRAPIPPHPPSSMMEVVSWVWYCVRDRLSFLSATRRRAHRKSNTLTTSQHFCGHGPYGVEVTLYCVNPDCTTIHGRCDLCPIEAVYGN